MEIAWLNKSDEVRAEAMKKHVRAFWGGESDVLTYTPHDPDHFERVENHMRSLIPKDRRGFLSETERMLLTWCAWTHDIGMNRKCYPGQIVTPTEVRQEHVNKSASWVWDSRTQLKLTRSEAQIVSYIIRYHSRKHDLKECVERLTCDTSSIRARLIAAYLRLADAMDVSQSRIEGHEFDRFALFQDLASQDRDEILFHWVKSFVVAGIVANHSKQVIEVEFQNPEQTGVDESKFGMISRYVVNELKEELETVEAWLDDGGVSSFHGVDHHVRPGLGNEEGEWPRILPSVIRTLQMVYSPNATGITRAALESLGAIISEKTDRAGFRDRLSQLIGTLGKQLERRNCHNEVSRINRRVGSAHQQLVDAAVDVDSVRHGLNAYAQNFLRMLGKDSTASAGEKFWEVVEGHYQPEHDKPFRFLLFGCSETIASILALPPPHAAVTLYIAEGRAKTIHKAHNSPVYIDAEAYLGVIREKEREAASQHQIKPAKVIIIPDACVATACLRDDLLNPADGFSAVLFGANGIYYEAPSESPRGAGRNAETEFGDMSTCVAHTVGHLGVAVIARAFSIPIVVVAAAAKVWPQPIRGWQTQTRGNPWLTSYPPTLEGLRKDGAKIDWTPREEHVPLSMLSYLVTDLGVLDLRDPPDVLRNTLKSWDDQVEQKLQCDSAAGIAAD